jgi:23S rRNA (pseudouridine1915-N3)-methyltransferase
LAKGSALFQGTFVPFSRGNDCLKIQILAIGKLKAGPLKELFHEYAKRIRWEISLEEIENLGSLPSSQQKRLETNLLIAKVPPTSTPFFLDEKGKNISSQDFAHLLDHLFLINKKPIFIIGGAEGIERKLCPEGAQLISFGMMTWPHLLARILLIEQLYRAQEILNGTKYHRI